MEEGVAHEGLSNGDIRGKFKWPGGKEAFQTDSLGPTYFLTLAP